MGGGELLSAALGAVVVIGSLFGFSAIAERQFVTRREFDAFRTEVRDRLDRLERVIEGHHSDLMRRIDTIFPK